MNKEDYFKYYIQGSDHYLIPKDIFNELFDEMGNWREEAKELKKQLEEWNHHLKCSKEMLDIQGHNGNYNYDSYMLGIYNGMEYIIALFETREPIFKSGKDIEFISELQQENKQLKDKLSKIETLIINHNCDTGDIYYKYNSRFLKSELKQRILEILYEEGSDGNEY